MVFASIREHAEHCDFFASTSRNKENCFASLRATQKFGEHEQASTHLNFASKLGKGKILRAVKNFNGPFITPSISMPRDLKDYVMQVFIQGRLNGVDIAIRISQMGIINIHSWFRVRQTIGQIIDI